MQILNNTKFEMIIDTAWICRSSAKTPISLDSLLNLTSRITARKYNGSKKNDKAIIFYEF